MTLLQTDLTVRDAMVTIPKTLDASCSAAEIEALLVDEHVHLVLVVDGPRLVTTVGRDDGPSGTLVGRTVDPDADLETTRLRMVADGTRRLAVVDQHGRLLGLLCLKRTGAGFCSDAGVQSRSADCG